METNIPAWIERENGKATSIEDLIRYIIDDSPAPNDQKLYISSAREWRDRGSFLPRCYAIDALKENRWVTYGCDAVSPDKQFVTIRDDAVDIDREWKEKIFDNRVYRFINGDSIRLFGPGMEPIKIELSFSELVGEE